MQTKMTSTDHINTLFKENNNETNKTANKSSKRFKIDNEPILIDISSDRDQLTNEIKRRCSLRKLEIKSNSLRQQQQQQQQQQKQPKIILKKQQSASQLTTTTTTSTSTTPSNNNNTFACLRNLGSTCYINCILQVMRYTPGFVISIHRLNMKINHLESFKNNIDMESEISLNHNVKFVKNLHQVIILLLLLLLILLSNKYLIINS
jgi:hypothetical protein